MSTHLKTFLPLRVTSLRTVNPSGSLMTISNRRTEPALSYILSQFCFTRCLIRDPAMRLKERSETSVTTSPSNWERIFFPRKLGNSEQPSAFSCQQGNAQIRVADR